MPTHKELELRVEKLEQRIKCSKPKVVTSLPTGNTKSGFVIYNGDVLYWTGTEWSNISSHNSFGNLPVYLNDTYAVWGGLEIGDLYLADPLNIEGWDAYSIRQVQMTPSYFIYNNGVVNDAKLLFTPADIAIFSTTVLYPNYTVGSTTITHNNLRGVVFGSDFLGVNTLGNNFMRRMFRANSNIVNPIIDLRGLNNVTIVGNEFMNATFQSCANLSSLPSNFTIPPNIVTVGNNFVNQLFSFCISLSSLEGSFNIPQNISSCGTAFMSGMFVGCTSLTQIPFDFSIPQNILTMGDTFCSSLFIGCTNLTSDAPSVNLIFPANVSSIPSYAINAFGGTCPITPDSPTPLSLVPVKRG